MDKSTHGLRDTLLWTYSRGTWQYDLICALILAFIFLIPPSFFLRKAIQSPTGSSIQQPRQSSPDDTAKETQKPDKAEIKGKP